MRRLGVGLGLLALVGTAGPVVAAASQMSAANVERTGFTPLPDKPSGRAEPAIIKAEVLLARARVSPGSIDGIDGDNLRKALGAYQRQAGLPDTGRLDQPTWKRLAADTAPVMRRYTITPADARGPFTRVIPAKFELQSRLKRLGYHDIGEALAERFHMSVPLLRALNARAPLRAGGAIDVVAADAGKPDKPPTHLVVDKTGHAVEAFAADGSLLAFYPASIGSTEKPAPSGTYKIRRIVHHPDYTYLPRFAFKGVGSKTPFRIAPGPNNPVGSVWMDLSYEGYGIHGTPNPEAIGKTESHGCIRLTNWDAENLAAMVEPEIPVFFQDGAGDPQPPTAAPAAPPVVAAPAAGPAVPAAPEGNATGTPPPAGTPAQ